MLTRIAKCLIPVLVGTLGISMDAHAGTNGAGLTFKASNGSDAGCFSATNYGSIVNNCADARWLSASLPVSPGLHGTFVRVFGNSSSCQTVSTNGVGSGDDIGAMISTPSGPKTWHSLGTGDRMVGEWTPLVFRCLLESGGIIAQFSAG